MQKITLFAGRWVHAGGCTALVAVLVSLSISPSLTEVFAQSVKVGRTVGGSGFHIPSYVAIDKGFLKAEGLDANFIAATAGVLVRATIAKEIEFTPIPGRGSGAMLKGAPLGLIYADHGQAGAVQLDDKQLSLLRTLRNQAVMAFRQAAG